MSNPIVLTLAHLAGRISKEESEQLASDLIAAFERIEIFCPHCQGENLCYLGSILVHLDGDTKDLFGDEELSPLGGYH